MGPWELKIPLHDKKAHCQQLQNTLVLEQKTPLKDRAMDIGSFVHIYGRTWHKWNIL